MALAFGAFAGAIGAVLIYFWHAVPADYKDDMEKMGVDAKRWLTVASQFFLLSGIVFWLESGVESLPSRAQIAFVNWDAVESTLIFVGVGLGALAFVETNRVRNRRLNMGYSPKVGLQTVFWRVVVPLCFTINLWLVVSTGGFLSSALRFGYFISTAACFGVSMAYGRYWFNGPLGERRDARIAFFMFLFPWVFVILSLAIPSLGIP